MALSQGDRERGEGGRENKELREALASLVDLLFSQSLLRSQVYHPWKFQMPGALEKVREPNGSSQGSQGLCVKHGPEHLLF